MSPEQFADIFLHDAEHLAELIRNIKSEQLTSEFLEAETRLSNVLAITANSPTVSPEIVAAVLCHKLAEPLTCRTASIKEPCYCGCGHG
jgi:hypothetical protein